MFAQANSRALPPQDLQRRLDRRRPARAAVALPDDPRDRARRARRGTVFAYSDNAAVMEGAVVAALLRGPGERRLRLRRRAHAHADEGRDAQPPDRDLALPGRGHRLGRRDPRRGRDRARRQAEGRARRLLGLEPAHPGRRAALGRPGVGSPTASPRRSRSCSRGRSAPPRSTTSSAGRTSPATSAPTSRRSDGVVRGYHKPIMLAGGVGNVRAPHAQKDGVPPGALLVQLGGPGMLIGMGGGSASSMSAGANTADLDFDSVQRGNAEIQRRAPGGDRPLLGARRGQPDPLDPRRRRGRAVERAARARARGRARRARSTCARCRTRSPA